MVSLSEGQKASLSPEAVKFLSAVRHPPMANTIANWATAPRKIPGLRSNLAEKMAPGEAELIRKHGLKVREITIADVPVVLIEPAKIRADKEGKILLNMFGGAFVMGSARDRTGLTMAAELGIPVYSVAYTRAPEARYPVARDQCLAVYRALLKEGPPGRGPIAPADIWGMGSSAGAQLFVSTLLVAKREGLPINLGALYLCSPALDLSMTGDSMTTNASNRDIMPLSLLVSMVSQNYVPEGGIDPKDPLYSPMYAQYDSSFPRTVISTGTRDFALSTAIRFHWKLRDVGVETELLVEDGMWHGFNWDPVIPEALRVRKAIVKFLEIRS